MGKAERCPMCGEDIDTSAQERLCAWCRMLLPADRTFFVLHRPGRLDTYCSAACVRSAVLTTKPS